MKKSVLLIAILTITLSLLFLSSFVSANEVFQKFPSSSIESFYLTSSSNDISMCSCSTITESLVVVNDGGTPSKIDLESNLGYVSFSQNSVNLVPGSSQVVYIYIHAPCSKNSDVLEITGTSIYGESQVLKRSLSFNNCDNLGVIPGNNITASLCTPFQDSFTIVNKGSFSENYEISVNSFEEFSSVSNNQISIPANSKLDYSVSYNLPCDISEFQTLDYTVKSLKNSRTLDFSNSVFIDPSYNFEISGPSQINVCDSSSENFTIKLSNNNNFQDGFLVKLDAPSFVDLVLPEAFLGLEANTLILNGSSFDQIPLVINPKGIKNVGTYNISIVVTSLSGDVSQELIIPLTISHCYDFSNLFNGDVNDVGICPGESKSFDLVLEHKGTSYAITELNLTGPDFVKLDSWFVGFDGKEGKTFTITINETNDLNEMYPVTLDAYFQGELVDSINFNLYTYDLLNCYGSFVTNSNLNVLYDSDYLYVTVKNSGLADGSYIPVIYEMPSYLSLNSNSFVLNSSDYINLEFKIDRDELYSFAVENNNGSIIGLSDSFSLSLFHSSGQEFISNVNINFVNYPWYKILASNLSAWWTSLILCFKIGAVLVILGALLLLILLIKLLSKRSFISANILGLLLLILVIVSIVVVFIWQGVPTKSMFYEKHELETNSTIYLRLNEDSSRSFDLTEFFFDADDNIVSYDLSFENSSLLSGNVKRDTLKLKPSKDWNGLTSISIVATDAAGESASSGSIFVDVLPVKDYTCKEFYSVACAYVNLVLLIIVSLLLYFVFSLKKKIKEVKNDARLTSIETVVVKQNKPNKDVVAKVDDSKKKSTTKNSSRKVSKKSTKKAVSKTSSKKVEEKNETPKKSSKNVSKRVSKKSTKKSSSKKTSKSSLEKSDDSKKPSIPSGDDFPDFKPENL